MLTNQRIAIFISVLAFVGGCKRSVGLVDNAVSGTVQGVLTDKYGTPLAGYHVTVFNTTVTTASDGSFSFGDVVAPYDLVITPGVQVYKGLTNRTVTLVMPNAGSLYSHTGTIRVQVDTMDASFIICFEDGSHRWEGSLVNGSGLFSIDVGWAGSSPLTGTIHVLKTLGSPPSSYVGYASRAISLVDTVTSNFVRTDFINPPESSLDISLSSGSPQAFSLFLFKGDVPIIPLWYGSISSSQLQYYIPSIQSLSVGFFSTSVGMNNSYSFLAKNGINSSTSSTSVSWGAIPAVTSPVSHATDVSLSTVFTWSNTDKAGVYLFTASPDTNSSSPRYYVWTESTSASIPDLTRMHIPFPHDMPYTWSVYAYYGFASINELTTSSALSWVSMGNYSWSQRNQFRTAP